MRAGKSGRIKARKSSAMSRTCWDWPTGGLSNGRGQEAGNGDDRTRGNFQYCSGVWIDQLALEVTRVKER